MIYCIIETNYKGTLTIKDGQSRKILNNERPLKIQKDTYLQIKDDPRINLIEEIVEVGEEKITATDQINEEMKETYEQQLSLKNEDLWELKRENKVLKEQIVELKNIAKDPVTLRVIQIKNAHHLRKPVLISEEEDPRVLEYFIKSLEDHTREADRTPTDKKVLEASKIRHKELQKLFPNKFKTNRKSNEEINKELEKVEVFEELTENIQEDVVVKETT